MRRSTARGARRHALYRAYVRVDRRVFGSDDDPLARVPLRRPGVPLGRDRCLGPGRGPLPGARGSPRRAGRATPASAPGRCTRADCGEAPARRSSSGRCTTPTSSRPSRCAPRRPRTASAPSTARSSQSDHVSLHRSRCRAARRAAHLPARRLASAPRRLEAGGVPRNRRTPEPGRSRPTNAMMARLAVARRQRGPAQARERLAAREAVVHRVPAGLRAAHADHASSRPVLRGPVPLPARRPPLRLLRGLRRELRARRHLLPRDRRGWTALLAAARPPAGLPPLVSLRVRGGRRRLHAARDRGAPDGRALPSGAVPGRMDARAGPPEGRHGDGRHAAAPRGQVVAVRRARRRRRPPDRRALPVLLRLPARRVGAASPEPDRLGRPLAPVQPDGSSRGTVS